MFIIYSNLTEEEKLSRGKEEEGSFPQSSHVLYYDGKRAKLDQTTPDDRQHWWNFRGMYVV